MSLTELQVTNLIFIDSLQLVFSPGLNIITGETGAGKSLLLNALSLVLGEKVSPRSCIRQGASQATVTAVFSPPASSRLEDICESRGIPFTSEIILRRTLYRSNTSKCWINDQPVTLQTLQITGDQLVDIHGQNQHQTFLKKQIHLQLLDVLGNHKGLLHSYRQIYQKLKTLKQKKSELEKSAESRLRELDMLQYQHEEISAHNLEPGRDEELEQQRNVLKNAHELKEQAAELMGVLYNSEISVFSLLSQIRPTLETFSNDTAHPPLAENFQSLLSLTEELFRDIHTVEEKIDINPQTLHEVEEELNQLYHLKRKYGPTLEDIISYHEKIQRKIEALSAEDQTLENIEEEIKHYETELERSSHQLTDKRKKLACYLEKKVTSELQSLAFNHPHFAIKVKELEEPGPWGKEEVEFLISTNPDRKPRPLRDVASGGEISRIMLALKTVFVQADRVPTMVFDEIDTGIGSVTAHKVGEALQKLADNHQVLCITHLPQIAIKADRHLVVDKDFYEGKTCIQVRNLEDKEEQEKEITRLLGLDSQEDGSRRIARDLLDEFHSRSK